MICRFCGQQTDFVNEIGACPNCAKIGIVESESQGNPVENRDFQPSHKKMKKATKSIIVICAVLVLLSISSVLGYNAYQNNPNKIIDTTYGVTLADVNNFAVKSLTALHDGSMLLSSDYKISEIGYKVFGKSDYVIYIEVNYTDGMEGSIRDLYCAYTDAKVGGNSGGQYYPLEQLYVTNATAQYGSSYSADSLPHLNVSYLLKQLN